MAGSMAHCVCDSAASRRPCIAQARPPQTSHAPRGLHGAQCLQAEIRSKRKCSRPALSASALDAVGKLPVSLEDDPFLFELEPSQSNDPQEGKVLAVALAKLAWETKAESVRVLHVAKQSSICSYMVIATVFSRPQLNAVLGKLERAAAEEWSRKFTPTGGRSSWEMLDLGDVIVNVMSEDARLYYDLEGLYAQGTPIDLPFMRQDPKTSQPPPTEVQQWSKTL